MTTDNVENLTAKISFIEKKLNRIEQLLLLLVEDEYLSESEKERITQADQIIKDKEFDKLVKVE